MAVYHMPQPEFVIEPMAREDIPAVAELYASIRVTRENYKVKLTEGPDSFARRGGMFEVLDREGLVKLYNNPEERVLVARSGGEIVGVVWYALEPFRELFPAEDTPEKARPFLEEVRAKAAEDRLVAGHEVICTSKRAGPVAISLFREMMLESASRGLEYLHGCLYRVESYTDEEGEHPCGMENGASRRLLERCGGVYVGTGRKFYPQVSGYKAKVTELIYLWDTKKSAEKILHLLKEQGWEKKDE